MPVLEVWKNRVKAIPFLAGPLRSWHSKVLGLMNPTVTHIRPRRGLPSLQLWEIWQYRDLLVTMAVRDFQIRYQQTILGVAWAILPTLMAGVFFMLFSRMANLGSDQLPFAAFYFAAVIPWNFFSYILTQSSLSLTSNFNLLHKVYFPRLILPLKSVMVGTVDMLMASSLILGTMWYYGRWPGVNVLWLPVFLALALLTAFAIGLWIAALNVYFRDLANVLPYCLQLWFFMTPIIYSPMLVQPPWRSLMRLNPMASVVLGCRWCLFGVGDPPDLLLGAVFLLTLGLAIGGLYFFRKVERTIADVV